MSEPLLEVKNLRTSFFTNIGEIKAVNGVSFNVNHGEVVAIVGESGCGKSVSQLSIMQLVQTPPGRILGGEVIFNNRNLLELNSKEMRKIRGHEISMIFQEPMTSLNPVFKIGTQITEVIQTHSKTSKKVSWKIGEQALADVSIPDPEIRMHNYPFEMSGGMRQRVLIAISVACKSELIIADEPTTALDVTTQAQIMELLQNIVRKQEKSMVIVTHNLGLVTRYADRIYVMYAGRIVESGTTEDILTDPKHPYTLGLLKSIPKLAGRKDDKLIPIEGLPPSLVNLPEKCAFLPRCPFRNSFCEKNGVPALEEKSVNNHYAACFVHVGKK